MIDDHPAVFIIMNDFDESSQLALGVQRYSESHTDWFIRIFPTSFFDIAMLREKGWLYRDAAGIISATPNKSLMDYFNVFFFRFNYGLIFIFGNGDFG